MVLPAILLTIGLSAQPEPKLPRPGAVVATQVIGEVSVIAGDKKRPIKVEERVRVGATVVTGRRSIVTLEFSNGAIVQLGSESELEIEEFGQETFSSSIKPKEEKEEPSLSRTRLRLVRGDVSGDIKRLKASRGSSFQLVASAGTLRITEGSFRAHLRMSDVGLGVYMVDVPAGKAEFEPLGGTFAPVVAGKQLTLALETDRSGNLRVGEMPAAAAPPAQPGGKG